MSHRSAVCRGGRHAHQVRCQAYKQLIDLLRAPGRTKVTRLQVWEAQKRLCQRYRLLQAKGKLQVQVCTAVARASS